MSDLDKERMVKKKNRARGRGYKLDKFRFREKTGKAGKTALVNKCHP